MFCKYFFSQFAAFIFLTTFSEEKKLSVLVKSWWSLFSFMLHAFGVIAKKSVLPVTTKTFSCIFF